VIDNVAVTTLSVSEINVVRADGIHIYVPARYYRDRKSLDSLKEFLKTSFEKMKGMGQPIYFVFFSPCLLQRLQTSKDPEYIAWKEEVKATVDAKIVFLNREEYSKHAVEIFGKRSPIKRRRGHVKVRHHV